MKSSLIVPTYRRSQDLKRCLTAVKKQNLSFGEVIVVVRMDDRESSLAVQETATELGDSALQVRSVPVTGNGVIAAMQAGLDAISGDGDIIALTDDDAAPWPDWLERIERAFEADPQLGGIGGKDWQYKGDPPKLDEGAEAEVGVMRWWGKVVGNHHHAAAGSPREVSVLKGVNCAYRVEALRQVGGFDTRLRGTGAQVHWELSLGLTMKRAGWKLVFDPTIGVDHFPAMRFDEDQRERFNSLAQSNAVYNETLVLTEHFKGLQRLAFFVWAGLMGTRSAPGLMQIPRLLLDAKQSVLPRYVSTLRGRLSGAYAGMNSAKKSGTCRMHQRDHAP